MAHNHTEKIICPNCGNHATDDYCSKCGQENHLHKETFWGLVMHFIGHYFHYDSKFLQTMKALWFSPGKLTIAYMNKQRMKYIPPISLYIFISAVFFLFALTIKQEVFHGTKKEAAAEKHGVVHELRNNIDSLDKNKPDTTDKLSQFLSAKNKKIASTYGDRNEFVRERMDHNIPKIFFFMIPVMAGILKLLFINRKDAFFVDHAIFSLHYHSFWFSLLMIQLIPKPAAIGVAVQIILYVTSLVYMTIALHKVYVINWFRSVAYMLVTMIAYVISFLIVYFTVAMLILALA